jgi:hypothetical protein
MPDNRKRHLIRVLDRLTEDNIERLIVWFSLESDVPSGVSLKSRVNSLTKYFWNQGESKIKELMDFIADESRDSNDQHTIDRNSPPDTRFLSEHSYSSNFNRSSSVDRKEVEILDFYGSSGSTDLPKSETTIMLHALQNEDLNACADMLISLLGDESDESVKETYFIYFLAIIFRKWKPKKGSVSYVFRHFELMARNHSDS